MITAEIAERFQQKVRRADDGCLVWTAAKNNHGYGVFSVEGKLRLAHRVAYELQLGGVPAGLTLDHLCRNRACCEVSHLEPVTQTENLRRGATVAAANAAKTHCPQGHPYAGDNLYINPKGDRLCRACNREKHRKPSTIVPDVEAR